MITTDEQAILTHISRWGSDGYAAYIRKVGRVWTVEGFPTVFRRKRDAVLRFEAYLDALRDRKAGRV